MKKSLLGLLLVSVSFCAMTACQKQEEDVFQTKEESMIESTKKAVQAYPGSERIVFKNHRNEVLKTVTNSESYSYEDDIPTRPSNNKYHYEFSGWNVSFDAKKKETIATANFRSVLNEYKVRFVDNGEIVSLQNVKYGELPIVPEGFEANREIRPVFQNTTYNQRAKVAVTRGTNYTDGLIFQLLESKGEYAIEDYYGEDSEIVIPSTYEGRPVTTIFKDTFKHAIGDIKTIYIPNTVNNIEENAFRGISCLDSFVLEQGNEKYYLDASGSLCWDDVWYPGEENEETYKHLLYVPSGKFDLLEISTEFYSLDDGALNKTNATILKVSTDQFLYAEALFGGSFDNNVKQVIVSEGTIGSHAFEGMKDLYSITLSEEEDSWDYDEIGDYAFKGCTNLRGIIIPDYINVIGQEAFKDCVNLEEVTLSFDNLNINKVGKHAFLNTPKLEGFDIDGVTYIGNNTYKYQVPIKYNNDHLPETLYLPEEVLMIPDQFFAQNSKLKNVIFTNATRLSSIGEKAFYQCANLDLYSDRHYLPTTLNSVGYKAFASTKTLSNESSWFWSNIDGEDYKYCLVHLKLDVNELQLGKYAKFLDAYGLRNGFNAVTNENENQNFTVYKNKLLFDDINISLLHISRTATGMATSEFGYYTPYTSTIAPYFSYQGALTEFCFLNKTTYEYSTKEAIHTIGEYAFYKCKMSSNLYFGSYLESVGEFAFYNGINADVTLNIRDRAKYAGNYAFYSGTYSFTLKFVQSAIPETWEQNFDGEMGSNSKNHYLFNQ